METPRSASFHSLLPKSTMPFLKYCCLVLLLTLVSAASSKAEMTSREKLSVMRIATAVKEAGASYQAGEYETCGEKITAAVTLIEKAMETADQDVYEALLPQFSRISRASALLELEGIRVAFKRPEAPSMKPKDKPAAPGTPTPNPPTPPKPAEGEVSFANDVAPILVQQCGRCHINGSKGNFTLTSFAALMKGPPEGVVVFAGDIVGSRLIEVIETGDMPRGSKMPPKQLQTLKEWVLAGAKFDGPAPEAPLMAYAGKADPAAAAPMTPKLETKRSTGSETVSFANDVAPLLVANCNGCHLDAMQTRGGLRLDTFAQLLRGGDSGSIVTPGNGASSLLVQKLRGEVGDIMPAGGRPKLSDESIQLISTWIDEGATLDGLNEDQPIRTMANLAWAKNATHEELMQRRQDLAQKAWNLGATPAARQNSNDFSSPNFYVLGSGSKETMEAIAKSAEATLKSVQTVVDATDAGPMYKGRATIFVLPKRYEYAEFAKMVERRSIPSTWTEHWQYNIIDAYVPMVVNPDEDPETLSARLIAPLTSLAVASQGGDVPRWLAEGIGRANAAKLGGRDNPQAAKWREELPEALAVIEKPDDFLKGRLTPERTDLVAFGLGNQMLERTGRRQFDQLIRALKEGMPFTAAFTGAFGGPPQAYVDAWLRMQANSPQRRGRY